MKCPHCQAENKDSAKFCCSCGRSLLPSTQESTTLCRHCQTVNPPTARFCKKCGQTLASPTPDRAPENKVPVAVPAIPPSASIPPPGAGQPKLICLLGAPQGMTFRIGQDKGIVIGRAPEADIVISGDREISKRHAWIGIVDGQIVLRDLGSTNGTFVNHDLDTPIRECMLREGDTIALGRHDGLKFRLFFDHDKR